MRKLVKNDFFVSERCVHLYSGNIVNSVKIDFRRLMSFKSWIDSVFLYSDYIVNSVKIDLRRLTSFKSWKESVFLKSIM